MINLFVNFYNDSDPARQQEINECLSHNIENILIDKIFLIVDAEELNYYDLDKPGKIEKIVCQERPAFSYLFELANTKIIGDDISIISNTDIYFEEYGLSLISSCLQPFTCYALSRWDRNTEGTFVLFDRADSQDCWIFKGQIKHIANSNFSTGLPGCDNAIAQRIEAAGYTVLNPSRDIRAIHIHITGIRNYDNSTVIEQPYKYVQPCNLDNIPSANWITEIAGLSANDQESQFEEDAIIKHIFDHIGVTNKYMIDLGAGAYGDSTMSNTRRLIQSGWNGYGVDVKNKGEDWIIERLITPGNILDIFEEQHTPKVFDFLNLDIDSCDFWVLQKILEVYSPRCICTEYNGTLDPSIPLVLKYENGYTWDETNKYGYSFAAGKKLLAKHDYMIIYNQRNQNIFAVKKELVNGLVFNVGATQVIYHPVNPGAAWELY